MPCTCEVIRLDWTVRCGLQAAKAKKKSWFSWKFKLAATGAVIVGGYYAVDSALHPRPKSEVVQVRTYDAQIPEFDAKEV